MAEMVNFKKGLLSNLPEEKTAGTFYVTTDERAMYLDIDASTRIRLGDFQEFESLTALRANTNPSTTALYYVADVNVLAKFDGENYIQINLDTGATSIEVVGDGNAVTAASYDPATRKLTLTMGETFVKTEDIGDLAGKDKVSEEDLSDALKEKVNAASEGNHSHDNKTVLDGITAEKVADWDTVGDKADQDDLDTVEGKVNTLIGDDADKSVRTISTEEATKAINDFATKVSDDGVVNSFKELVDWAAEHGSDAAEMTAAITAIQAVLAGIGGDGQKPTVVAYVTDAIAALSIGDYAKAADLTALAARVTALEGDAHTHDNKALLDTYTQTETDLADAVSKKHEHANAAELAKIADGDKAKWDTAAGKADTAVQEVATGAADGHISVDGTDVAVKGLSDGAFMAKSTAIPATGAVDTKLATEKAVADAVASAMTWGSF